MGPYHSHKNMELIRRILLLSLLYSGGAVNFPGQRSPTRIPIMTSRVSIYSREDCTDTSISGATTVTPPVVLAPGEGRQFISPGYDGTANYAHQAKCIWTFSPASGSQLSFSCSAFNTVATSAPGDLCKGDFLRFYDEGTGGSLGSTGERYCDTTPPSFTYNFPINVLFNSNNDGLSNTGFDCEVVSQSIPVTTTTTTTTTTTKPTPTTTIPPTTDCITIGGAGSGKTCLPFSYGSGRIPYDGCINLSPPGQYVSVVPGIPAPRQTSHNNSFGVNFGAAPRIGRSIGSVLSRHSETEVSTMFWCATQVDPSGYVMEWGECQGGCKADPSGSFIPAPSNTPVAPRHAIRSYGVQSVTVGQLVNLIQNLKTQRRKPHVGIPH